MLAKVMAASLALALALLHQQCALAEAQVIPADSPLAALKRQPSKGNLSHSQIEDTAGEATRAVGSPGPDHERFLLASAMQTRQVADYQTDSRGKSADQKFQLIQKNKVSTCLPLRSCA